MSRELRALGYRKLSARPRHHAQAEGAIEHFKTYDPPRQQAMFRLGPSSLRKRIRPEGKRPRPRWRSARFGPHKSFGVETPFLKPRFPKRRFDCWAISLPPPADLTAERAGYMRAAEPHAYASFAALNDSPRRSTAHAIRASLLANATVAAFLCIRSSWSASGVGAQPPGRLYRDGGDAGPVWRPRHSAPPACRSSRSRSRARPDAARRSPSAAAPAPARIGLHRAGPGRRRGRLPQGLGALMKRPTKGGPGVASRPILRNSANPCAIGRIPQACRWRTTARSPRLPVRSDDGAGFAGSPALDWMPGKGQGRARYPEKRRLITGVLRTDPSNSGAWQPANP